LGESRYWIGLRLERNVLSQEVLAAFILGGINNLDKFTGFATGGDDLKAMRLKELGF
jgi:hypothetical protein